MKVSNDQSVDNTFKPRFTCPDHPDTHTDFYVRCHESSTYDITADNRISETSNGNSYESGMIDLVKCSNCNAVATDNQPAESLEYAF